MNLQTRIPFVSLAFLLGLGLEAVSTLNLRAEEPMMGVNLAGAEFNDKAYWPTADEVQYFLGKGMNTIRVPILWERLQPSLGESLDAEYLSNLDTLVNSITDRGAWAIIDPHNYARYQGDLIGSEAVSNNDFADLWTRLASHYQSNPKVVFGLMNEPNTMPTEQWVDAANAAISAIRTAGASHLILVPGNAWTGAYSWTQNWYGTANSIAMLNIVDSGNNFLFELHQYFDGNFSGLSGSCADNTGSEQLSAVTAWLETHGQRAVLAEFAGGDNETCRQTIEEILTYLEANPAQWAGWIWWAAGPAWPNDYIFTLEPTGGVSGDRPQMDWLEPFLGLFMDGFESGDTSNWSSVR